jgi:tRNA threonylcarbamoyladenosine biosynthesis protein TsaB
VRLLALATAGPFSSVGLSDGRGVVVSRALGDGAERGRGILREVDALLREQGLAPKDLDGIVVEAGPGSFTGVRLGVATAKGLASGLDRPVVGVSSLDALAHAAGPADHEVLALRDARSGEAWFALYRRGPAPGPTSGEPPLPSRLQKPTRGDGAMIRAYVEERGLGKVLAVGEDAERLAVTLHLSGLLAGVRTPAVCAADLVALALPRFAAGTTDDVDALAPIYLQPSTPEKVLAAKRGGTAGAS